MELDQFLSLTVSWSWAIGKSERDVSSIHSFVIIIHSFSFCTSPIEPCTIVPAVLETLAPRDILKSL